MVKCKLRPSSRFPFAVRANMETSYRTVPGWVKMILIRKATDISAFGIDEKNQLDRFEKAFKGVPPDAWHVFEDPKECGMIVRKLVRRSGK